MAFKLKKSSSDHDQAMKTRSQSLSAKVFCFSDCDLCDILSQTIVLFDNSGKANYLNKGLPDQVHCRYINFCKEHKQQLCI